MNPIIDFLNMFREAHPIIFWIIAILGFPEAELIALIAIAIGFLAH